MRDCQWTTFFPHVGFKSTCAWAHFFVCQEPQTLTLPDFAFLQENPEHGVFNSDVSLNIYALLFGCHCGFWKSQFRSQRVLLFQLCFFETIFEQNCSTCCLNENAHVSRETENAVSPLRNHPVVLYWVGQKRGNPAVMKGEGRGATRPWWCVLSVSLAQQQAFSTLLFFDVQFQVFSQRHILYSPPNQYALIFFFSSPVSLWNTHTKQYPTQTHTLCMHTHTQALLGYWTADAVRSPL